MTQSTPSVVLRFRGEMGAVVPGVTRPWGLFSEWVWYTEAEDRGIFLPGVRSTAVAQEKAWEEQWPIVLLKRGQRSIPIEQYVHDTMLNHVEILIILYYNQSVG